MFPIVPAWLGAAPPADTVFVPNGDILCRGPLGPAASAGTGSPSTDSSVAIWVRYDQQGRRLSVHPEAGRNYDGWTEVYCPERDRIADLIPAQKRGRHSFGGYLVVLETEGEGQYYLEPGPYNRTILAVLDYDGTRVDPDKPRPLERRYQGTAYPASYIRKMYDAQVELGLTDPAAVSPYAGTAEGPVYAGDAEAMLVVASSWGSGQRKVIVRPLDDPENPYREQYSDWDRYVLANAGGTNPLEEEFNRIESALHRDEHVVMAGSDKPARAPTMWRMYEPGAGDPMIRVHGTVDEQGFLVPVQQTFASSALFDNHNLLEPYPRVDSYSVSGWAPRDSIAQQEYDRIRWAHQLRFYPRIPEWLLAQPVFGAVLVPNGEIVTLDAPGSFPADGKPIEYMQRAWAERGPVWHRFSADGELLATAQSDAPPGFYTHDWQRLYFPGYAELQASAAARELRLENHTGYLILRDKAGMGVGAYNFEGQPLDINTPLIARDYSGSLIMWQQLLEVAAAQAAAGQQ
jgi:hypothetical protein